MWSIDICEEFEAELEDLPEEVIKKLFARIDLLVEYGVLHMLLIQSVKV